MKIAIGICARNEESSIIPMLDSLISPVLKNPNGIKFHIFICANGCNDQTVPLVQAWRAKTWAEGVYSVARFELAADDGKTRLVFDQAGVPEDAVEHIDSGWKRMYWEPLLKYLSR
jgi:hypothetical protein